EEVIAKGKTKSSIRVPGDLQIDLRIVKEEEYGAALIYFTGSKDHNITIRNRAIDRDWKLNEYGLFDVSDVDENDAGERAGERLASEEESDIYEKLDLAYIEPELREDTGEVAAAADGTLPNLIQEGELQGDLQVHTTYSDGNMGVQELASAADERGLEYIAVTDHGPGSNLPQCLDGDGFNQQRDKIKEMNEEFEVTLLHGIEAEITNDGLAFPENWKEELDVVVAAMHTPTDNPTTDIVDTFEEEPIDVLAHPLNRKIHEREPMDVDLQAIVDAATNNAVAIEINAQPARLDLPWRNIKEYRNDAQFVISTDAHRVGELDFAHLGISQARRGWCEAEDILNTRELEGLLRGVGR
ncbi:MAG: PHP domain-containing protein, partial [Halobacteriaceae archaeon]